MPPQLALLFCTVFVLFLLHMERKQAPTLSRALWIPTIWMLHTASKPLGIRFESVGDVEAGSPLDRVFLSGLFCLGLFILTWRKFNWSRAIMENYCLMLLIGYMLASVLWSDIPFVSFKRWARELIAVVMALIVLTERKPHQAMQSLLRRTVYILIPFSLLLIKYFPLYGVQYHRWSGDLMWIGVCTQKNGLGRLCLISAFFLIWGLIRRWKGHDIPVAKYKTHADVFVLILTLVLLKGPPGSYSATSATALAVGLGTFIGLLWMKNLHINLGPNTLTVIMALIIAYGVAMPIYGGSSLWGVTFALGRSETLTGRTDIWANLLPIAERRPILGYGFGGYWTSANREIIETNEAHNGYLDVRLELGFVGLLLLALFLLSCCREGVRALSYDYHWGSLSISYLIMALVHNLTESSINTFTSHLTAVVLLLCVSSTQGISHRKKLEDGGNHGGAVGT